MESLKDGEFLNRFFVPNELIFYVSRLWQIQNAILIAKHFESSSDFKVTLIIDKKNIEFEKIVLPDFFQTIIAPKIESKFLSILNFISFIYNFIDKKDSKRKNIFFLDKWSGLNSNIIVTICCLLNFKIVLYQHGENYSTNSKFSWSKGWVNYNFFQIIIYQFIPFFKSKFYTLLFLIINFKFNLLFNRSFFSSSFVLANKIYLFNNSKLLESTYKSKAEIVGSMLNERILLKNTLKSSLINIKGQYITIYSLGVGKVNCKEILNRQANLIRWVYEYSLQNNLKLLVNLKPGEYNTFNKIFNNLKNLILSEEFDFKTIQKSKIIILPIDSVSCIEFSLSNTPFLIYNLYENNGIIAKCNLKYNVPLVYKIYNSKEIFFNIDDCITKAPVLYSNIFKNFNNSLSVSMKISKSLIKI